MNEKREAIRIVRAVMNDKEYAKYHGAVENYLIQLCEELAYDCQKIIQTCELVLAHDENYSEQREDHNAYVIME